MATPVVSILVYAIKAAGIPIHGVSVGADGDRSTWRAFYTAAATAPQRTAGDAILATIDLSDAVRLAALLDEQAHDSLDTDKKIQAVAIALWECITLPLMTKAQLKARVVAIYKTL